MDAAVVDPTRGPGGGERVEVTGLGPVPAGEAREHLLQPCAAESTEGSGTWLRRLWADPDQRALVAMTSRQRVHADGLRRLIELRDQTCRIPWCDAITQIDHARPAARGGPTTAANEVGVCQRHHLDKGAPGSPPGVDSTGLDPGAGPHTITLTTPTGRMVLLDGWLRAA